MLTQRMLQTGVSFEKLDEIIHEKFLRVAEDLPSSSQWQQLREKALHRDLYGIRVFLRDRREKARTRKSWGVTIGNRPLDKWIEETFLGDLSQAPNLRDLKKMAFKLLGLNINLPDGLVASEFDSFKKMIVREALVHFVEGVILVKEHGLMFRESEGPGRKMEVKTS